jgi:starch synthase
MADTVTDYTPAALAAGEATGFMFEPVTVPELNACVTRACALYGQTIPWRKLKTIAMRRDFGWRQSAAAYLELYRSLTALPLDQPKTAFARHASPLRG